MKSSLAAGADTGDRRDWFFAALIAVDTNILVYAHREEFTEHGSALSELKRRLKRLPPGPCPSS